MNKVSIIIPTYNEAENIIPLIESIETEVKSPHEILVVDDDSPDKTWELVETYIKQKKTYQIKIIRRMIDHGLTKSIQEGITRASGDIVVWMDSDFSHPPKVIPELISKISATSTIVVASRFVPGGRTKEATVHESTAAIFLSTLLNKSLSILFQMNFHDFTSGFIAIKKPIIDTLPLCGDYGEYFIDLMVRANRKKYSILEIPYTSTSRLAGQSKTAPNLRVLFKRGRQYCQAVLQLLFQ